MGLAVRLSASMLGFVVFLMCCGSSSAQTNQPLESIEIAIGEWKPFVTQTVGRYGQVTEIVTVVLERAGYRPKYIFMPWGQALKLVKENESDLGPRATFPFISTDERRGEFLFSTRPVFEACYSFFYNRDKISRPEHASISTIADLSHFRFGFVSKEGGYQYPQKLTTVLENKGRGFNNLFEAFKALVDPSVVQVVPAVWEVGQELLDELFPEQRSRIAVLDQSMVENGNHCLVPAKFYLLVGKRNPNNAELMTKFNKEYEKTIDSQTAARIKREASERPSTGNPEVVLSARDSPRVITGRDAYGQIYHLPRGTRGLLLDWRQASDQQPHGSAMEAEVRVISGPYRGKTLIVDGKFVVLK